MCFASGFYLEIVTEILATCPFILPVRPAVPFCLSRTDMYVHVPVLGTTCVCIAMELRMRGT